jgi:hypothetical protein
MNNVLKNSHNTSYRHSTNIKLPMVIRHKQECNNTEQKSSNKDSDYYYNNNNNNKVSPEAQFFRNFELHHDYQLASMRSANVIRQLYTTEYTHWL